jgi:hypothetical protein
MDVALIVAVVALVISFVALAAGVVTLPTAFQMFWGRPTIVFEFSEIVGEHGKELVCGLSNAPIESKILRRLGVHREMAIVTAKFRVCEAGSNHIVMDTAQARLIDIAGGNSTGSIRGTVSDQIFPLTFQCAFHPRESAQAMAVDPWGKAVTPLLPGRYRVDVDVICGDTIFSKRRDLTVGNTPLLTYWLADYYND